MKYLICVLLVMRGLVLAVFDDEVLELCKNLKCTAEEEKNVSVCGTRIENEEYRFRIFDNKCQLLKNGCEAKNNGTNAYGIIPRELCNNPEKLVDEMYGNLKLLPSVDKILNYKHGPCPYECSITYEEEVCGIKKDGSGFRVKLFSNICEFVKHNCKQNDTYVKTYLLDCQDLDPTLRSNVNIKPPKSNTSNIIVIQGPPFTMNGNINDSINDFFASTHAFKLPLRQVTLDSMIPDETRRNMLIKRAGPQVVYKPISEIPDKRSDDPEHAPFLQSCFHSCPKKCPDHYSPVCGFAGLTVKEPALVFKNHCYMDIAQCAMRKANASDTAPSAFYNENTFMFCIGENYFMMLRFLPIIRTLQHMGRLKQYGKFYYRFRNMRYLNDILPREGRHWG